MNPWWLLKNFPFAFESWFVQKWNQRLKLRPGSGPFISGDAFRGLADYRLEPEGQTGSPESGGVFFVHGHLVPEFWIKVRPRVQKPFLLISHNSDWVVGPDALVWLSDPLLVRWFAQNAVVTHPHLIPVPIGLENASRHSAGVVASFLRLRRQTPSASAKLRIAYGFSVVTNFEERMRCWRSLLAHPLAEALPQPLNGELYRKLVAGYQFIASPEGNGPDCHRSWEALLLGVFPIVTKSPVVEHFVSLGLPFLVLDCWEDLERWDAAALQEFAVVHQSALSHPALLMDFWKRDIERTKALL